MDQEKLDLSATAKIHSFLWEVYIVVSCDKFNKCDILWFPFKIPHFLILFFKSHLLYTLKPIFTYTFLWLFYNWLANLIFKWKLYRFLIMRLKTSNLHLFYVRSKVITYYDFETFDFLFTWWHDKVFFLSMWLWHIL